MFSFLLWVISLFFHFLIFSTFSFLVKFFSLSEFLLLSLPRVIIFSSAFFLPARFSFCSLSLSLSISFHPLGSLHISAFKLNMPSVQQEVQDGVNYWYCTIWHKIQYCILVPTTSFYTQSLTGDHHMFSQACGTVFCCYHTQQVIYPTCVEREVNTYTTISHHSPVPLLALVTIYTTYTTITPCPCHHLQHHPHHS